MDQCTTDRWDSGYQVRLRPIQILGCCLKTYLWSSLGDQFARWTSASEHLLFFVRGAKTDIAIEPR
jgi:hypothetical protein